jgi:hypothetical protein
MAFVHGKKAQFALRDVNNVWRDLTSYTSEVTLPAKAGIAETTVFGRGAKTYIGGLLEGTMTMKGFFDPTVTSGPDVVLSGLLGSQPTTGLTVVGAVTTQSNYGQAILFPSGVLTGIGAIVDVVITDYQISAPVSGVVAFNATFQMSGAPTLPLTYLAANQTAYAAATYGLQVVRAPATSILSAPWNTVGGLGVTGNGAATYAALIGSTL